MRTFTLRRWNVRQFHLQGQHNQKDHGRRGGAGGSGKSIDGVGNVDDYLANNPQKPGEPIFVWHGRLVDGLPPQAKHDLLFEVRETYEPVEFIADAMTRWRAEQGLPEPQVGPLNEIPAPMKKGDAVARAFETAADASYDPKVQDVYAEFKRQSEAMYEFMTRPESEGGMGIEVEMWTDPNPANFGNGPYPDAAAQAEDLRQNRRIKVESGLGGAHEATMSVSEYDRFRAVHDVFGHAGVGTGFDRHGEYQAYLAHASMYTGDGHRGMASEYHGVNTSVWGGAPGSPGTGKSVVLPERLIENPWDENGNLKPIPEDEELLPYLIASGGSDGVRYLIDQAGISHPFAQNYDRPPLHFDGPAPTEQASFRLFRFRTTEETVRQFRFDPSQPRVPAGQSGGGRWTSGGGGGSAGSNLEAGRIGSDVPVPSRAELEVFDPIPETDRVESTMLDNMDDDGNITPERMAVHDEILERMLTDPETGQRYPRQERPKALMMGGGAASGKSSAIRHGFVEEPEGSITVNPDDLKLEIPESKGPASDGRQGNGLADEVGPAWSSVVHEESSYLGKRLMSGVLENRMSVVVDKVNGKGNKAVAEIKRLQDAGYDVDVAFVTTDVERAVAAAKQRQESKGRAVPSSVLRNGHTGANQAFLEVVAGTNTRAKLISTVEPNPDGSLKPPILTAESDGNGGLIIRDPVQWSAYLTRVPGVPEGIRIIDDIDERLVASAGIRVTRSHTLAVVPKNEPPVLIDYDRMKELYGAAMAHREPPAPVSDYEREVYEDLREEIDEMRANGIAFDFPIDD